MTTEIEDIKITPQTFQKLVVEEKESLLIVDVRAFINFNQSHIQNAINLCVPKTLLKRKGLNLQLVESGAFRKADSDIFKQRANKKIVMYDQKGEEADIGGAIAKIADALIKENVVNSVLWLEGGFQSLSTELPELVVTIRNISAENKPENKFKLTEISSAPVSLVQQGGLVRITDYLFLGGSEASEDYEELTRNGIKYIINTASELKNSFEDAGIKYIRFDLIDVPSQKICEEKVLNAAFNFIDMARKSDSNVLVHCKGGRSRSATVVIAYLMKKNHWPLQEAYNYVQSKSPIVSPNLGFIGQLYTFESQLKSKKSQSPQISPSLANNGPMFFSNSVTLTS